MMSSKLPIGCRFHPTDEELVDYFLRNKISGRSIPSSNEIVDYDIYMNEPWFLPHFGNLGGDMDEMYFFVVRELKTKNSKKKPNRVVTQPWQGGGWWKASGGDKDIRDTNGILLGKKKSLVFHKNSSENDKDGKKTNWIMHEYSLPGETFQEMVLCKIRLNEKKKAVTKEEEMEMEMEIQQAMVATFGADGMNATTTLEPGGRAAAML